jgi:hypothetical protein
MQRAFYLIIILGICFSNITSSFAQMATIRGQVVRNTPYGAMPAPNIAITVRDIFNRRSSPAYSGFDGMYVIFNVLMGPNSLEIWTNPATPLIVNIRVYDPLTDIQPILIP